MRTLTRTLQGPEGFRTGRFWRLRPDTVVLKTSATVKSRGDGHAALVFSKRGIEAKTCAEMLPVLRKVAGKSRSRAQASGPLKAETLRKVRAHPQLRQANSYAYVQFHPGKHEKPGGFQYANSVESGTAGWTSNKTITRFTAEHFDGDYQVAVRLAGLVDRRFAGMMPARHKRMAAALEKRPRMSAAFTTMAANHNFRTALHRDNKTLEQSALVFTMLGDDAVQGGLLAFPQLNVAVDLRVGDVLAFDADLLHCNTAFSNAKFDRLSCVFYAHV